MWVGGGSAEVVADVKFTAPVQLLFTAGNNSGAATYTYRNVTFRRGLILRGDLAGATVAIDRCVFPSGSGGVTIGAHLTANSTVAITQSVFNRSSIDICHRTISEWS